MTDLPALETAINACLKESRSNRVVNLRLKHDADTVQVTVYDPDAGMYYAMDYIVEVWNDD